MIKTLKQSIGRVIRHKDDFGSVVIFDSRFKNGSLKSKWMDSVTTML